MERKYYEAYDDRYLQIHALNLQWFCEEPTDIVLHTIERYGITKEKKLLEIGCGEGRDASALLRCGYDLLATDISPEAIRYCAERAPEHTDRFRVLDCVAGTLDEKFDFIYAVAVIHMLVEDTDRDGFYQFIGNHLCNDGIALICTMGDGETERCSDVSAAFDLQDRIHQQTGIPVRIAGTSCRMVGFPTFFEELRRNGLSLMDSGITSVEPDFNCMMYAIVCRMAT